MTGQLFRRPTAASVGAGEHRRARRKPRPADLADNAATMTTSALARHYRVHHDTVERWLADTGVTPAARRRAQKPRPKAVSYAGPKSAFVGTLPRDASLEGQAADVLRRLTFVYRCGETGAADQKGRFWRYGNAVLTGPELVERAKRHGFDPEGWKRVGAEARA